MTTVYEPPLKEIGFVFNLLEAEKQFQQLAPFTEIDADLMQQVVAEAGRYAKEVLFPLNVVGDRKGARYQDGKVNTPPGFVEAYRQFREGGWPSLSFNPDYGGQGLPQTLNTVVHELIGSANHAWTMYVGLLSGAVSCVEKYGSPELKAAFLPKMVSGEWLATMCLTEPQAGSDLGLLTTKAVLAEDGSYKITGNKIFISGGDQDLTENIVHLVLARLPDAPKGSRGISLFLVPKLLADADGGFTPNRVQCTGIEEKMGIHGSATCSMQFDGATGWIVGQPGQGLASMFVMMNSARLLVGIQGVGTAEVALQSSLAYARERMQMRAPDRPASRRHEAADPIILHPAMQRLIMNQKAFTEGIRMMIYWAALHLDLFECHSDADQQAQSARFLALLTPVIKSAATEQSFKGASDALQIFGGHGFITETGIDQYLRDSRITLIYEGTNEIQAIDLLLRKILSDNGAVLRQFYQEIAKTSAQCGDFLRPFANALMGLCEAIEAYTQSIAKQLPTDSQLPYRIAHDMLRLVAHSALGWFWLRAAQAAQDNLATDPEFFQGKLDTASYYFNYLFPETRQHQQIIELNLENSRNGASPVLLAADCNG